MKHIALAIIAALSLSLTACEFNELFGKAEEELPRAAEVGGCVLQCVQDTYGEPDAVVLE